MRARRIRLASAVAVAMAVAAACSSGGSRASDPVGQAAAVMHVDADLARYTLDLNDEGGSLTVEIDDDFELAQIERLRAFLRTQQQRIGAGDVSGLRAVLGAGTPGLRTLARDHAGLRIAYVDVPQGARLVFRTDRPALVAAVHRLLDTVLERFGSVARVPAGAPTTTTTPGPSVPSDFLG